MGMFGGGSTTYFNTSTMPLYDETVPGMLKQTVMSATTANQSMSSTLLANVLNSNTARLAALYRFAESGTYQWGLPDEIEKSISSKMFDNIKATIQKEAGEPVIIGYSRFDNMSRIHATPGSEWTLPNTPNKLNTNPKPADSVIAANGYGWYYVVEYSLQSAPDEYLHWWFDEATASVNSILHRSEKSSNPYFPIIPFRVDGVRWDTLPQYKSDIRRACHFLGLDSRQLGEDIQELSDESKVDGKANPIEEAYVYLGVPINTDSAVGREYLFRYFLEGYKTSAVLENDYAAWLTFKDTVGTRDNSELGEGYIVQPKTPPRNSITISDITFETVISWSYIKSSEHTGQLTNQTTGKPLQGRGFTLELLERPRIEFISDIGDAGEDYTFEYVSDSSLFIRKQLSTNRYHEVEVRGLGFSSKAYGKELYYTLEEAFADEGENEDKEKVCIPLNKDIFKGMGRIRGHDLVTVAVRMQLNNYVRIKHKRNWISIIATVVSIVLTILYPPAGTLIGVATRLGIQLVVMLVMRALSPMVTRALQNVFGEELGAVLAVIVQMVIAAAATQGLTAAATPSVPTPVGATVPPPSVDFSSLTFSTAQMVNLALDVAGAYQMEVGKAQIDEYIKIVDALEKESAELSKLNDLVGIDDISGIVVASQLQDTNEILKTNLYVQNSLRAVDNGKLLIESTSEFTEAMRFTGRKYSPINSARIL